MMQRTITAFAICMALTACGSNPASGVGPAALAEALLPDTSEFQRPLIEDGVVTGAEYDTASVALVGCIQNELPQAEVSLPSEPSQSAQVSQATSAEESEAWFERASEAQSRCRREYYDDVQALYVESLIPSGAERQQQRADVLSCLASVGVDDPLTVDSPHSDVLDAAVRYDLANSSTDAEACVNQHQFAFLAPYGS